MRRKSLLLLLCITTLTLSACGKTETPVMSSSVETITEEVAESSQESTENVNNKLVNKEETVDTTKEDTTTETTSPSNGEGEVDTPSTEGFTEELGFNPVENITKNPDGTYSFSDSFMTSLQQVNGFSDLTDANKEKLLQEVAPFLIEMDNEDDIIAALGAFVGMYEYDQAVAKQEQTQKQQQTQNQQKPQQSQPQQSTVTSNNNTPPASSQEQNISGRKPADGTAGSRDENAGTISGWR